MRQMTGCYQFHESFRGRCFRATPFGPGSYSEFHPLIRARAKAPGSLKFRWDSGLKRPGPFVWTTVLAVLIRSDVKRQLRPFSGWHPIPVRLFGKDGQEFRGYSLLSVSGRCGPLLPRRSKRAPVDPDFPKMRMRRGLCFAEHPRRSADIMIPRTDNTFIFVRQGVRDVLNRWKAINVELEPCEDVEIPELVVKILCKQEREYSRRFGVRRRRA